MLLILNFFSRQCQLKGRAGVWISPAANQPSGKSPCILFYPTCSELIPDKKVRGSPRTTVPVSRDYLLPHCCHHTPILSVHTLALLAFIRLHSQRLSLWGCHDYKAPGLTSSPLQPWGEKTSGHFPRSLSKSPISFHCHCIICSLWPENRML